MKKTARIMFILAAALALSPLYGALCMPKIFSDGMVFQRDMPVKIWGTSDAGADIKVVLGDSEGEAKAGADGSWTVMLKPMPASKDAREMVVFENGREGKRIRDILVGEVWVLGGQSNMAFGVSGTTDYQAAKKRANNPFIRYFWQSPHSAAETPQKDFSATAKWIRPDSKNIGRFSGVGYYFGEMLAGDLNVPVGLIHATLGATSMIAWIPAESMQEHPYLASEKRKFDEMKKAYTRAAYKKALEEFEIKVAAAKAEDKKAAEEGRKPKKRPWDFYVKPDPLTPLRIGRTPVYKYNGMVAPLNGYRARGVLWYQGEGDAYGRSVLNFAGQFKVLVNAWRKTLENENLHFYWVQLTSYSGNPCWPAARWAQLAVRDSIPLSGVVNTIDLGELNDIHPKDKTSVASRLEKLVLRNVYGMKNVHARAPELKSVKYGENFAEIVFSDFGRGLVGRGKPRGFEVLSGGEWRNAVASLDGLKVVVKSPDGGAVDGVRYLWKAWAQPDVWLFNKDGLPAFSFRKEKVKK